MNHVNYHGEFRSKKADDKIQHLAFDMRLAQNSHESLNSIPIDIIYLCILFLYEIEYFAIIGSRINLSTDRLTITKDKYAMENWLNTSYGKIDILSTSESIATWKIKVGKFNHMGNICMGITSTTNCTDKDFTEDKEGHLYAVSDAGTIFQSYIGPQWNDALKYGSNDIVTIILNLKDATLSYAINEKEAVVGWSNIKIDNNVSYRFAVSMRFPLDSVSIDDFALEGALIKHW